jgi:light-regulated signal transduction histidine kinase (bacteriophytochrome)
LRLEPTELSVVVAECLTLFTEEVARRGVHVVVGPLPQCTVDRALIKQVLVNLIGNGLKYTGQQVQPRLEIGARAEGGEHIVFVRDNGAGFDMSTAGKLFTPFERLHANSEFEGSGMGLVLVKQVINRHNGRVWAEAVPGQGASFFFTLPEN